MMKLNRGLFAALVLGCLASLTAQAQPKIAIIDMKSVFEGYWKRKQSDATIKERQGEFEKERKRMVEDYEKLNGEFRQLDTSAKDPAASEEERRKRKDMANSKLLEIREIETSVQNFQRNFTQQIQEQIQRMREQIMKDIREVVEAKSKTAGYNLVVNTAADSAMVPTVMFAGGLPDLTQDVLTELNIKAPPGSLDEKKPEEKKPDAK
jgi:Skp family chaperone for outer membrane proteins